MPEIVDLPLRKYFPTMNSMSKQDSTCWTMVRAAAEGIAADREDFARRYAPVIRAYLVARWKSSEHLNSLKDAEQDVFLECFKRGGVLDRVEPERAGGFRAFLYGVVRNVALRVESPGPARVERQPPSDFSLDDMEGNEEHLSRVFDRAWARSVMKEAAALQAAWAEDRGTAAVRRVELLRLRYEEELPIPEIARRWETQPDRLYPEFTRARGEFRQALREVIGFHHPDSADDVDREYERLMALLE